MFVVARIMQVGIMKTKPMILETKNAHPVDLISKLLPNVKQ